MTELLPPRMSRALRRRVAALYVVAVAALLVAVVAGIGAWRADQGLDETGRTAILEATGTAVTSLMTFAPDDPPQHRRATDALLADPLRLEYRNRGVDVVLPGARASSIGLKTTVVGAGLSELSGDRAKVLVFLDQSATAADGQKPIGFSETADAGVAKTSSARWAFMRKVNGNWLLSDLQPVGDVTR